MASLIHKSEKHYRDGEFVEMKIYEVPISKFFPDGVKYSLSYIKNWKCALRYDNEASKGHHMHIYDKEIKTEFRGIKELEEEFWRHVEKIRGDGQ